MPIVGPDHIEPIDGHLLAGSALHAPGIVSTHYKQTQQILDGGVMTSDAEGNLTLQAPVGGGGSGNIDGGDADSIYGGTDPIEGGGA